MRRRGEEAAETSEKEIEGEEAKEEAIMFRRAVGSLVARRISPRATSRTAPARSLHSLKDLPMGDGLINVSVVVAGFLAGCGGGAFAIRHSKNATGVGESAAGKVPWASKEVTRNKVKIKKPDMEARFERWIAEYNKTYRDEEEKARRFQLFKATVEGMESRRPPVQESLLPEVNFMADFTKEELQKMLSYQNCSPESAWVESTWAKEEKGEPLIMRPDVKQVDTQAMATQVSA